MLRNFLSIFLLISLTSADDSQFFRILIREFDNPAGTHFSGQSCSDFGFVGLGCNTWLEAGVIAQVNDVAVTTLNQQINSRYETSVTGLNLIVEDENAASYSFFEGFTLQIRLASQNTFADNVLIDSFTININTTDQTGIYSYTSQRNGTLPTTLSIAWSTNIPPFVPSTTSASESTTESFTGSTTAFTGSTTTYIPTTTPILPKDCSEIPNLSISGAQTIYPDGVTAVQVFCDVKSYGILTVIQSRDSSGSSTDFNQTYDSYTQQFGNPSAASNYWFGLENMNVLTNQKKYTLLIDVCCGNTLSSRQIYHGFKIGSNSTKYKLSATADLPGIGLDYSSSRKDIGSEFSTYDTYSLDKSSCDEFGYASDDDVTVQPYGGWWFGSCGNNLNGALISNTNETCSISSFAGELGVNLRTTTGTNSDGWDVDLISYNRVRMAIFTFDSLLIEKSDDSFCKN
ncbi:unnamed protein product [Caenorhabditis angaria]|uniref:Fibrinogen C-terminal domain-containing protein n=1 Tax=Caenorhabditis angaria TaxID=860376 RepID=A0A9P1IMW3_9PELO|nr:unnamed protein product [Caenorhabditis angaria]